MTKQAFDPSGAAAPARLLSVAVILALAWFVLPIGSATYNEGFQATIVMNADAIRHGGLGSVDPLFGLNNDFFLWTRFGLSVVLAAAMQLGLSAVWAFRLLMLLALAALLAVNVRLLNWRYRVGPVRACIPFLLFPGLFESAWFFNDNVLSAALSSAGLLLFWRRTSLWASAGAAALWGLAVACRSDAALIAPAFAILAWVKLPGWGARIRHAAVAMPVAVAVPFLIYGAFGLNLLDIIPLTRRATALWARTDTWAHVAQQVVKGVSLPGLLALSIGAAATVARRRWLETSLCLGVPLLYGLAYGRMLTEVRYLLPLTPFFGLAIMEAWEAARLMRQRSRRLAWTAFAALLVLCFAPPVLPPVRAVSFMAADHDMPRLPFGRFWSPIPALWWNARLDEGAAAISDALDARMSAAGPVLVVSAYWTPDRMVDLLLRQKGFELAQAASPPACRAGAEWFMRGNTVVVHVRTHLPMIPSERAGVNWVDWGLPCLGALGMDAETAALVVGWAEVGKPPPSLAAPGVTKLFVSQLGSGLAQGIEDRRYGYFVAEIPARLVPTMLEPALNEQEGIRARAAIAVSRMQPPSRLPSVWPDRLR